MTYTQYKGSIESRKGLVATITGLAFALIGGLLLILSPLTRAAPTVVVTPDDLAIPSDPTVAQESWYFYDDTDDVAYDTESAPNYEFTNGPGNPTLGDDSISFQLTGGLERWNIATNQFAGTDLDDISDLKFDMYTPSSSAGGTGTTLFLNFDIDFDNTTTDGYQGRLVYVPGDNTAPSLDTWETWDSGDDDSLWRWSGYDGNSGEWQDGETDEMRTLSDIKSSFPDAEIFDESFTGQFLIRAGHPGPDGLEGSVDNIVFNDTAYNFEEVYPVSGEITKPETDGETLSGSYEFTATYDDGDDDNDAVQWAIKEDDCISGSGAIFGNTAGNNTPFDWDGQDFSSTIYLSGLEPGEYCFVFNPTDDPGQEDVRVSRDFLIEEVEEEDETAPVVRIRRPSDGQRVRNKVNVRGFVRDDVELSHYNLSLYPASTDLSDGLTHSSERIAEFNCEPPTQPGTTNTSENVRGILCKEWDTTVHENGMYQLRLAARDAAGNRDTSTPYVGGDDSVHVVSVNIRNRGRVLALTARDCFRHSRRQLRRHGFENRRDCLRQVRNNNNQNRHNHNRRGSHHKKHHKQNGRNNSRFVLHLHLS